MRVKLLILVIAIVLISFASNVFSISFVDHFTGVNGSLPNANDWNCFSGQTSEAWCTIQTNQLRLYFDVVPQTGLKFRHVNKEYDLNFLKLTVMQVDVNCNDTTNDGGHCFLVLSQDDKNDLTQIANVDANTIRMYYGSSKELGINFGTTTVYDNVESEELPVIMTMRIEKISANDFNISFFINNTIKYSTVLADIGDGFEERKLWLMALNAGLGIFFDDFNYFDDQILSISTDFSYDGNHLDPEKGINSVNWNFQDTTTYETETPTAWYWLIDDVNVATTQNMTHTFTAAGDYNICLLAMGDITSDWKCKIVPVYNYPQDINFTWTPIFGKKDEDVNFFGTGVGAITNWYWQKNSAFFSNLQDTNTTFSSRGDWNVCLTAMLSDLNKVKCYNVSISGRIHLQFSDENMGYGIKPNLTINGTDYSSSIDSNGLLTLDIGGWLTKTYAFKAWNSTHPERYFYFDLNQFSNFDENLVLLDINKHQAVNFKMVDENSVVLANNYVNLYSSDNKLAGRSKTDSEGKLTFYLNGLDANYFYTIETATETLRFNPFLLNIKIPKAEKNTSLLLTPFNIGVSGIGTRSYSAQTFDVNFFALPNTTDYYVVNVDINAEWFAKNYSISVPGRPTLYSFQPYLVSVSEGYLVWFYVYDVSGISFPDVLIKVKKNFAGVGAIEIESKETDATGIAVFSFVSLDTYTLEFYYQGSLVLSKDFVPSLTAYYGYLSVNVPSSSSLIDYSISSGITVDFYPKGNTIITPSSPYTVSEIIAFGSDNLTISQVNVHIVKDGNVLYDANYTWGVGEKTKTLNQTIIEDANEAIEVINITLTITTNQGVLVRKMTYMVVFGEYQPYLFWNWLPQVKSDIGDFGALMIALFVAVFICGGLAGTFGIRDTTPLGIVFCTVLAAFTMIGWLNVFIFMMCCVFSGVIIIISRRELT